MLVGVGRPDQVLTENDVCAVLTEAFGSLDLAKQRVLVIIPDGTRTAPIPLFFRLLNELLGSRTAALDYLVALGTHPPMSEAALCRLVGITPQERRDHFPPTRLSNHAWDSADALVTLGSISADETCALSQGLFGQDVQVQVNRKLLEYDLLLVCGPVFPHEVAGFSGGGKYFFPGVSGPAVINYTHWLGALLTNYAVIGRRDTLVRAMIERCAAMIPRPRLGCCFVASQEGLRGVFAGSLDQAWRAAADLSAQVHVRYVDHPYQQVLSVIPEMYEDLWTGGKGMYKLEPVVADGGELIIYAPHIREVSTTHGKILEEVGYHVRDYFVAQWDAFKHYPWGVLAHSTHVKGAGTYQNGVESPRIRVTLATNIPRQQVARINLGYRDLASINLAEWTGREDEGVLLVPHAGETLFRLREKR